MPGASITPGVAHWAGLAGGVAVGPVLLLGVRVIAVARPSLAEHDRRAAAALGAVTNPALLDRLLDLPAGQPVGDPVVWAETSGLPDGLVDRGDDGYTVTRLLEPPLALDGVVVPAGRAGVLRAVQDASLFARFTCRWVASTRRAIRQTAVLEAQLCGVGLLDHGGGVVLQAEPAQGRVVDGWSWLLLERTYRCWLRAEQEQRRYGTRARNGEHRTNYASDT
jgi:hypothetical protein